MNTTISACTTWMRSMETLLATCIWRPPACSAPNSRPANTTPTG